MSLANDGKLGTRYWFMVWYGFDMCVLNFVVKMVKIKSIPQSLFPDIPSIRFD